MTGLYVARLDLARPHLSGVARKIEAQMKALEAAGFACKLLCIRDGAIELDGEIVVPGGGTWRRRANHHLRFHRQMAKAAREADFLYIRFQGAPPDLIGALARLKRHRPERPVLLEIPTWPLKGERQDWRSKMLGLVDDRLTAKLGEQVDAVVTFSGAERIFGRPTIRTSNGVDVGSLSVNSVPGEDDPLRLIGVANLAYWHGYDRVIDGLAHYPGKKPGPNIIFDVVGEGHELEHLRALAKAKGVERNVLFHGARRGAELEHIFSQAHIGVGSLGQHRNNRDTSDLKSREYCARGLPFLADRIDPDLEPVAGFICRVSQDDSAVDLRGVVGWYGSLPEGGARLRDHAEQNLTWDRKFAPIVQWLCDQNQAHA